MPRRSTARAAYATAMTAGRGGYEDDFRFMVLDSAVAYPALRRVVVNHRGVYAGCVLDALAEASRRNRGGGTVRRDRCRDEAGDEA